MEQRLRGQMTSWWKSLRLCGRTPLSSSADQHHQGERIGKALIPYAAISETYSNRWNLSIISDFRSRSIRFRSGEFDGRYNNVILDCVANPCATVMPMRRAGLNRGLHAEEFV